MFKDPYECPNCGRDCPSPDTEEHRGGLIITCPYCEVADVQPPAGGFKVP